MHIAYHGNTGAHFEPGNGRGTLSSDLNKHVEA
jgi:hypothetical protein